MRRIFDSPEAALASALFDGEPIETFEGEDYIRVTWLRADLATETAPSAGVTIAEIERRSVRRRKTN